MFQPVIVELAKVFLLPSPYIMQNIMQKRSISSVDQGNYGMMFFGYNKNRNTPGSAFF